MADFIKEYFSKAGLEFVPYDYVFKSNKYNSLVYKEKAEKKKHVIFATPYGLKHVSHWTMSLNAKSVVENMAEIAKELNVDYVMLVNMQTEVGYRGVFINRYIHSILKFLKPPREDQGHGGTIYYN